MNNILTYLDWRGDITFTERPLNHIDNVILSELAYIDFTGIVPSTPDGGVNGITLKDAYGTMMRQNNDVTVAKISIFPTVYTNLLEKMAGSARFGDAILSYYINMYDAIQNMQFAALCITLDNGVTYIAFRGTDQTIIGWRESFTMSFRVIPAQLAAVEYINDVMKPGNVYYVGGHSKGGSLAVYAAMMCRDELKHNITTIFNNDGPGMSQEMLHEERFALIKPRIVTIIPPFSVIGMLFDNGVDKHVVKSRAIGLMQHDAFSWLLERDAFIAAEGLHPGSGFINATIVEWLEEMNTAEREALVNHVFDALGVRGARYISDIPKSGIGSFSSVILALARFDNEAKVASTKLTRTVRRGILTGVRERLRFNK